VYLLVRVANADASISFHRTVVYDVEGGAFVAARFFEDDPEAAVAFSRLRTRDHCDRRSGADGRGGVLGRHYYCRERWGAGTAHRPGPRHHGFGLFVGASPAASGASP
jgi:hypothetical protein